MQFVYRQLVICVQHSPPAIVEHYVEPGTEGATIVAMHKRGWTAFAHGKPARFRVTPEARHLSSSP
jgi:hypothetical protein